jgi:hypothetical protein
MYCAQVLTVERHLDMRRTGFAIAIKGILLFEMFQLGLRERES